MKLTFERVEVLKLVSDLSAESDLGVAKVSDLIDRFKDQRKHFATRKLITLLHRGGLLENAAFGLWRLSDAGREALSGFA